MWEGLEREGRESCKEALYSVARVVSRDKTVWVQILTLPLTSCVPLGQVLNLYESQLPHLKDEDDNNE